MASISDFQRRYDDDAREPCKYGKGCYQKNLKHSNRFKHPPKDNSEVAPAVPVRSLKRSRLNDEDIEDEPDSKKRQNKLNDDQKEQGIIESDLPASPPDVRANIKQKFLVEMPDDFYSMWEFCKSVDMAHPEDVFKAADLTLVGPFDVLAGNLAKATKLSQYLCHHRYYYDPPEFQTVIKGNDDTGYHIGYFRDSPDEEPAFVGFNEATRGCVIRPLGDNLFSAVGYVITEKLREPDSDLKQVQNALHSWAKTNNFSLEKKTNKMKAREKRVVAKGFHGAGIVVPYDRKTQIGYRPLPETDDNLKAILLQIVNCKMDTERNQKFVALQDIITRVQFANDECDYGMGYELSLALFCYGHPYFHRTIELLMPLAYSLLRRPEFGQILEAHLKNRVKDSVSVIDKK